MEQELNEQIEQELKNIDEENKELELSSSRKPFVVMTLDKAKDKQQEMAVFTMTKKLAEYIFIITQKSPKKFRWSIVTRLQNASVEVVENLYQANYETLEKRKYYQKKAMVNLKLIDFYANASKKMQAITTKQMLYIAKSLFECNKLLTGWIKATKN